jgi:outer membrane receptor protein involved in Fe transport
LICSTALAETNGVITGTVQDAATRNPLANVLVTATSPALIGEQIVLTDAAGEYRVPQLPPGIYALRFEREDHKPFSRQGIEVQPGYTLRFNAELIPDVAGATTISVVGRPPVVDVASTQQGAVIDQDFIRNIALAPPQGITGNGRSFESVALVVPTARADLYGVSLNGTSSPENSYLIDGLSTRNPSKGISGSPLSVEFVESVAVTTGGYLPEYGRSTGGIIAANTRSGGNEFHGSIWGTWTPGALAGSPHPVQLPASVYAFREVPHNIVDFGASLGGFLLKDRLWFFVGVQPEFTRYNEYRDLNPYQVDSKGKPIKDANGRPLTDPTIYTRHFFADEHQFQYFAKLTYLFNDDHRLSLTVTGTPSHSGGDNAFSFQPTQRGQARVVLNGVGAPETLFVRRFDGNFDGVLKLSSSFAGKSVLLDVTGGWHHEDHTVGPGDGSKLGSTDPNAMVNQPIVTWGSPRAITDFETLPPDVVANCESDLHGGVIRCPAAWRSGGPGVVESIRSDSLQLRAVLTFLFQALGHHVLKIGFDGEYTMLDHVRGYSGGATLFEDGAGGPLIDGLRRGYLGAPDEETDIPFVQTRPRSVLLGTFVQDSWSILDRVTLNVGLRYDSQTLYGTDQVALSFPFELSPRVGLVWDFTQQGRSKIYASYARYFENVPLDLADLAFGGDAQVGGGYLPASGDCNPKSRITRSCATKDKLIPGGNQTLYGYLPPNPTWYVFTATREPVDPDTRPPAEDEVVAGVEYEILAGTRASFAYTHRNIAEWVEDMSFKGSDYWIGNPGRGISDTFPRARRDYNSFAVAVDRSFASLWLLQLSYTYQNLHGNIDGLFRVQTGQLNPNVDSSFDIARLTVNTQGPLAGDIRHTVKAYVAKQFIIAAPLALTVGLSYLGSSGPPIDFLGANGVPGYGTGEVFVFPRGAAGRLGWVHTIDLNGEVSWRFGSSSALTLSVNVFNLFNFQQVTKVVPNYTLPPNGVAPVPNGNPATDKGKIVSDATGLPLDPSKVNLNFLYPSQYQPVRQVRFQARVSF